MSAERKWTPGPWKAEASIPQDGFECYWIKVDREFGPITAGSRVTEIGSVNGPQWKEQEATAHLIAASPSLYDNTEEMRDALKQLLGKWRVGPEGEGQDEYDMIEAMISDCERVMSLARGEQP